MKVAQSKRNVMGLAMLVVVVAAVCGPSAKTERWASNRGHMRSGRSRLPRQPISSNVFTCKRGSGWAIGCVLT